MTDGESQIPLFEADGSSEASSRPPEPSTDPPGGSSGASPDAVDPSGSVPDSSAADPDAPGVDAPAFPSGEASEEEAPVAEAEPGRSAETAISVSELNATTRRLLERAYDAPLWVVGEVANWRQVSSGHCYFSLRDESAQISCVMWRRNARRLPTEPEEGMEVCARGQVSLYEARGTYQLMVDRVEARGEGLWRLAFQRLKRKLAEEGLLDDDRKRPLPRVPMTVGVVTSRSGAAIRDVVTVVRRRAPWTRVLVSDCRVQGEEASSEIVAALDRLVRHGAVDTVVVTRGGGSVEDLWCFNEEEVARAVAGCPVPVVSAVGHEVDVTITDLVADRRAPTPSAAGEIAVPDAAALRARLMRMADGLVEGLRERTRRGTERTRRAAERLLSGMDRRLERSAARVERLGGRLDALSPLATLRRGYAVPLDEEGSLLRGVESFTPGQGVRLRVVDGNVHCRVRETEKLAEEPGDV